MPDQEHSDLAPEDFLRAVKSARLDVVQKFVDQGFDINQQIGENGAAALHIAAEMGEKELLVFFIKAGAHLDQTQNLNWTALHYAARAGTDACVDALIDARAAVDALNNTGKTPLHLAAREGNALCATALIKSGATVNIQDRLGWTALHFASREGSAPCVSALIAAGAAVDLQDKWDGWTPLHYAAREGRDYFVTWLIKAGTRIGIQDSSGRTALHVAARAGSVGCIVALIEAGAEVHAKDYMGKTALDLATEREHIECIAILKEPHKAKEWRQLKNDDQESNETPQDNSGPSGSHAFKKKRTYSLSDDSEQSKRMKLQEESDNRKFKHGKDDLQIDWTAEEKKEMVTHCVMKLLTAGDRESGKSSLVLSLMSQRSNLTGELDRTRVAEYRSWRLTTGKTVPVYDLGGHSAYLYTAHLFHDNSSNNGILLCHDILSDDYRGCFEWLQSVVIRSPCAQVIPVLTKADRLSKTEIAKRKKLFQKGMKALITAEVKLLEKSSRKSKCNFSEESSDTAKIIIANYKRLINCLDHDLCVTSSKTYEGIEELAEQITEMSEKLLVDMEKEYIALYVALGKIGVKTNQTNSVKSDTARCDAESPGPLPQVTSKAAENQKTAALKSPTMEASFPEMLTYDTEEVVTNSSRQLQVIKLQDALVQYQLTSPQRCITMEDLKKALRRLHSFGLLIWHEGSKDLEDMIFNDIIIYIGSLKTIFNHNIWEELQYEQLDISLQENFLNKADFRLARRKFQYQGLMSDAILKCMLWRSSLEDCSDGVIELLDKLQLGHRVETEMGSYIYLPFYTSNKHTPAHVSQSLQTLSECSTSELAVTCVMEANISSVFWQKLCCRLVQEFYKGCTMQERDVFQFGFWAMTNFTRLLVQYNERNKITVSLKGKIEHSNTIWKNLSYINNICEELNKTVFPGLILSCFILCPLCHADDCTCTLPLEEIFQNIDDVNCVACKKYPGQALPSALIMPLPSGNDAKKRLEDLRHFLSSHCSENMVSSSAVSISKQIIHLEKQVIERIKEGELTMARLFMLQIDHLKIHQTAENRTMSNQIDSATANLVQQMKQQQQSLSKELSTTHSSLKQHTSQQLESLATQHRNLFVQSMLQSDDASRLCVKCQHPVLAKHQSDLEEHLNPDEDLLTNMVVHGVMSSEQRTIIRGDKTALGKVKRILYHLESLDYSEVKIFISALKDCKVGSNRVFGEILDNTYDEMFNA